MKKTGSINLERITQDKSQLRDRHRKHLKLKRKKENQEVVHLDFKNEINEELTKEYIINLIELKLNELDSIIAEKLYKKNFNDDIYLNGVVFKNIEYKKCKSLNVHTDDFELHIKIPRLSIQEATEDNWKVVDKSYFLEKNIIQNSGLIKKEKEVLDNKKVYSLQELEFSINFDKKNTRTLDLFDDEIKILINYNEEMEVD